MKIDLELLNKVIGESQNSMRSEILRELNGFVKINRLETHKIGGAISVFEVKEKIQLEQENKVVIGFPKLLENLKLFDSNGTSHQIFITGENYGYLLFADFQKPILHGTLKFLHQKIDREIELKEDNELRGTWSSTTFYLNGKELQTKANKTKTAL